MKKRFFWATAVAVPLVAGTVWAVVTPDVFEETVQTYQEQALETLTNWLIAEGQTQWLDFHFGEFRVDVGFASVATSPTSNWAVDLTDDYGTVKKIFSVNVENGNVYPQWVHWLEESTFYLHDTAIAVNHHFLPNERDTSKHSYQEILAIALDAVIETYAPELSNWRVDIWYWGDTRPWGNVWQLALILDSERTTPVVTGILLEDFHLTICDDTGVVQRLHQIDITDSGW